MRRLLVSALARPAPVLGLAALASVAACSNDTTLTRGRADAGLVPSDAATSAPLALVAGMRFSYAAMLKYDDGTADEGTSRYTLALRIQSVDDGAGTRPSTLTLTATGAHGVDHGWSVTYGFDSWVGRAGPSEPTDQVAAGPVTARLEAPPTMPDPPPHKSIPPPELFFLDLRNGDAIRSAWADAAHAAQGSLQASALGPDQDPQHRWSLIESGTELSMVYYDATDKLRHLELSYDPRGFLVEVKESLGDHARTDKQRGDFELRLVQGP